jgi:hypothetical protein
MHRSILAIAASTALIISGPAYAQRGHGGGKPTTSPSTGHGPTTKPAGGATTHGQSGSHGPATKPTGSGATTHGKSGSHGPAAKPTKATGNAGTMTHGKSGDVHGASAKNADTTTTKSTATTSTTTSAGLTTTLTPVQQKLQKNGNLADKLLTRMPEGTDMTGLLAAADGFKNLGQFVAAVNVSNNLGLKFTDLKTRMVDDGMSRGQAIQDVKKTTNVQADVTRAETEADAMIKSSTTSTTTTSTSTTSTSTKKTKKSSGEK